MSTHAPLPSLAEVRAFWDAHPCGAQFVRGSFGTPAFYEEHARFRYRTEWHLDRLVPWETCRGRDVLEIGCGLGADGLRFAQHGARYTGVDLTRRRSRRRSTGSRRSG